MCCFPSLGSPQTAEEPGGWGRRLRYTWNPGILTHVPRPGPGPYTHTVTLIADTQIYAPIATGRHTPAPYMPTHTHTLSWTRNAPLLHTPCLPSGVPPSPPFPAQGGDRHLRGCQLLPLRARPALMLLAHPVCRGLVGDASLPVHRALAPPCCASPQSHRGPRAWPLHPENL